MGRQRVTSLRRQGPPTRRFSAIWSLPSITVEADQPQLVGRLAIPARRRQTQQAQAFLARAKALAAKE